MKMRARFSFLPVLAFAALVAVPRFAVAADRQEPAAHPPGFVPADIPQFVVMSFDDNFDPEGVDWATDYFKTVVNPAGKGLASTYDGEPARISYFHNAVYLDSAGDSWRRAVDAGFETANHTFDHPNGRAESYSVEDWTSEIVACDQALTDPVGGIGVTEMAGFRTPFLAYNDATFGAVFEAGFLYDSSIQSCWADGEDGSNCLFPYTLDAGSPDNVALREKFGEPAIANYAGLWELPVSTLVVPPDNLAAKYGIAPGLRDSLPTDVMGTSYYEPETGRLAALDITLYYDMGMSSAEVLATLKHTFDLHVEGNRAPFVFVFHTHVYVSGWDANTAGSTAAERRAVIEDFVEYTLQNSATRVVAAEDVIHWMQTPRSLDGALPDPNLGSGGGSSSGGTSSSGGSPPTGTGGDTMGAGGVSGGDDGDSAGGCVYGVSSSDGSRAWLALGLVGLGVLGRRRRALVS